MMGLAAVDEFWINEFFGCQAEDYFSDRNVVCRHRFMKGYHGLFVLKVNDKYIISAPDEYIPRLWGFIDEGLDLFDFGVWERLLPENAKSLVGPAWIGYNGASDSQSSPVNPGCRQYRPDDSDDRRSFAILRGVCDSVEWEHSGIREPLFVQITDGQFVSAVAYSLWGTRIAQVGIITHPAHRGQGNATNVLKAITRHGVEEGLIMQFRTLCTNTSAIRTALRCGYHYSATHVSVRLKN